MVADGIEPAEGVVPPEGEDGERPVGLVTPLLGHGRAPEVVLEELRPWHVRPEVLVLLDGSHVVKNEVAAERVPVEAHADHEQTSWDQVQVGTSWSGGGGGPAATKTPLRR